RFWAPAYALALSLVVTAPLLAPGYLLLRDAVSTPRSYLSDAALGLSDAAPRALPQDFAVALASHVLDGGVVVKVLLIAGLWLEIATLALFTALAGLTPTGLLLAATVALVCSLAPGSGRPRSLCAILAVGAAVLAALPWLTAAAVSGSLSSSQAEGVGAFAA